MEKDEDSLKSKVIPYVFYFLVLATAIIHEWSGSRNPQAVGWLKFAAKNKEVIVTNVIIDPHPEEPSGQLLAVEIMGSGNGEKRAISKETNKIVKLSFTPQVGEKLTLIIKSGQVLVTRTGDAARSE